LDIPDGTVQILDLAPNSSQASAAYDGQGQTRYVNRAKNDAVTVTPAGTMMQNAAEGLRAYLADKVEPGGLETATIKVQLDTVVADDTITLMTNFGAGLEFLAVAGAPGEDNEFRVGGDDAETATNLVAAITGAANIAAMKALADNDNNVYVHAEVDGEVDTVVVLTAYTAAAAELDGPAGSALTVEGSATFDFTYDDQAVTDRLFRTHEAWTVAYINATATALLVRVGAGSAMTLAAINVVLLAQAGAELTSAGGSNSVGVLTEILSIFAGRIYKLSRTTSAGVLNQIMQASAPLYLWNPSVLGGFTEAVTVHGDSWANGEIVPSTLGGATQNREVGNIRHTYDTGALQISIAGGDLYTLASGVTLWPDSDYGPHFPWTYQGAVTATVTGARVVTVYDDLGNVLV